MFPFYTPWKQQKTQSFLFLGGIKNIDLKRVKTD